MKKVTTLVIVNLLWLIPGAQAGEISRITSAPGQSQSAWQSTSTYQSFNCPTGTARGEGVDMNFTTDRSDDTYFAYCSTIDLPKPASQPIAPATSIVSPLPTIDTQTATTVIPIASTSTQSSTTTVSTPTTITSTDTQTATISAFDYNAFMQMFIVWFRSWFNAFWLDWLTK